MRWTIVGMMLCGLGGAVTESRADESAPASEESWMRIELAGQTVGYEFSRTTTDGDEMTSESTSLIRISRFGQAFETKMILRSVERGGELSSFHLEQQTPGQPTQVTRGEIDGRTLTVTTTSNGQETSREETVPDDLLSPSAADRIVREDPPGPGEKRSFRVFSVESLAPTTITLIGLKERATPWSDGSQRTLKAVQLTRSDVPMLKPTFFLDDAGEVAKIDFGIMGMVGWKATRDEALAAAEGPVPSIDLGERTSLKVTPKPGLSQKSTATYRVVGIQPPATEGVQTVVADGDGYLVTAISPDMRNADDASEVDDKFLKSSRWVDWDNQGVQALAAKLQTNRGTAAMVSQAERLVHNSISKKSYGVGFATASEVAATKEGDCTEHGVLLAAVLRAAGLPSRVSFGLVYVESMAAFVPHMWTEVSLDGQWFPLDATRPNRPNGGYIKLGDSALESDAPLGIRSLIEISQSLETMSVEYLPSAQQPAAKTP